MNHMFRCIAAVSCIAAAWPAVAHHSFAMYDQTKSLTFTGKLTRFIPGANHAQLLFQLVEEDGTPIVDEAGKAVMWGVEAGPSARIAQQGVTPDNFPNGTIITVSMNPLRDGRTFGAMPNGTGIIHCGMQMPAGGCNAQTGTVYLAENN